MLREIAAFSVNNVCAADMAGMHFAVFTTKATKTTKTAKV